MHRVFAQVGLNDKAPSTHQQNTQADRNQGGVRWRPRPSLLGTLNTTKPIGNQEDPEAQS